MQVLSNIDDLMNCVHAQNLSLIVFKTENCSVCDSVIEKTEKLLKTYPNISGILISLDYVPDVSGKYIVFTAPTIILLFQGKEVMRQSRFISFEKLNNDLKQWSHHFSSLTKNPFSYLY